MQASILKQAVGEAIAAATKIPNNPVEMIILTKQGKEYKVPVQYYTGDNKDGSMDEKGSYNMHPEKIFIGNDNTMRLEYSRWPELKELDDTILYIDCDDIASIRV